MIRLLIFIFILKIILTGNEDGENLKLKYFFIKKNKLIN